MDPGLPLWLDEPAPAPRPPPRGDARCDVAIVGGGIAGCAAAQALAGHGLEVALLEARTLAARATGRNAGLVTSMLAEPYASLAGKMGREGARAVQAAQERNRARLTGLVDGLTIDCGLELAGAYGCASSPEEAEAFRASAALLRADGFDARFLEADAARDLLGLPGAQGALLRPGDGQVHPARLARGLAGAAERAGARLHEGAEVLRMDPGPGGWTLRGQGWSLRAPTVLVLANARAPALHAWFAPRLFPVRGQVLATGPVEGLRVPGPTWSQQGYYYWRAHGTRLVLGGGRPAARGEERGLDEALNARVQAQLDAFLRANFPAARVEVTHRWAGIMDFSVDGFPFVGPVPGEQGLLTAVGFTGHGLGWAFEATRCLAALVLEGRDEVPAPLRADRARNPALAPPA